VKPTREQTAAKAPPASRRGHLLLIVGGAVLALAGLQGWRYWHRDAWLSGFRVVATFPHDPEAYCQGLVFDGGLLHESTGRRGHSSVRTAKLETGEVLRQTKLPEEFFGEGLAMVGERLFQLTWTEKVARIYDRATLKPLDQRDYEGEGWGLTYDGTHLIQSDGTEYLTFRDPTTFQEVRRLRVLSGGRPVDQINELEMVEGEVWANLWKTFLIARIDPETGEVKGYVDLTGIFDPRGIPDHDAVLNGIAYDAASKRLFVTGKLWPKLFEIEVVAKEDG
jgi:glutaminyl-peptide cyclotransferase